MPLTVATPPAPHETLPMFSITEPLAARVHALGLEQAVQQLTSDGWALIDSGVTPAFLEEVRSAAHGAALAQQGAYFGTAEHSYSADMLLEKGDVFVRAILNERLLTMVEFMCGAGAVLSQVSSSVRLPGAPSMPLHCDQAWMPAPYPEHNSMMTACWYLDDIDHPDAGATKVIAGTHRHRRQPSKEEAAQQEDAVAILCPKGSIALLDGRVWHANYPRQAEGERVVLHTTYCRGVFRSLEDYGATADHIVAKYGAPAARLFGRESWFGNKTFNSGAIDPAKFQNTYAGR